MISPVFQKFLCQQQTEGLALAQQSELFNLVPVAGHPPSHFVAEFSCRGLARVNGRIVEHAQWAFGIHFPDDHLRRPGDVAQQLVYLGSAVEPWNPAIRPPFVCLHIAPGMSLVEIVMALFDLVTWNVPLPRDGGLNGAASQWARQQAPSRFPTDRRPLKRRAVPSSATVDLSPAHR